MNLVINRKKLTIDIDDRIKKFNAAAYDVLLNSSDLSKTIRCELVVNNVYLYCYMGLVQLMLTRLQYTGCMRHTGKYLDIYLTCLCGHMYLNY